MPLPAVRQQRSKASVVFTSTIRVLFTTLLFTAGGMGAGLFLGIVGTLAYGMISGSKIDMTNAYRHVAIPVAIWPGSIALHRSGGAGSARSPPANIPVAPPGALIALGFFAPIHSEFC